MTRAELFIWLACVLLVNQFLWLSPNLAFSFIETLVSAFASKSVFYYLGWYAVFRLLYESDRFAPSTHMDVGFALLIAALNFLPSTSTISWISATVVGIYLLATCEEDRK